VAIIGIGIGIGVAIAIGCVGLQKPIATATPIPTPTETALTFLKPPKVNRLMDGLVISLGPEVDFYGHAPLTDV